MDDFKIADEAAAELIEVRKCLREIRRTLARDWEAMTPRERSNLSRIASDLEQQQQMLEQTIELNSFS